MTTPVPKTTGSGDFASTEEPVTTEAALDNCDKLASQERISLARLKSAQAAYQSVLAQSQKMCLNVPATQQAACAAQQQSKVGAYKSRVDTYTTNHLKLLNDIRACKGLPTKPTASTAEPKTTEATDCTKLQAQAQATMDRVTKMAADIATQTKAIEDKCGDDMRCKTMSLQRIGSMKRALAVYQRNLAKMQADLERTCKIVLSTPTSSGTQTTPEPETTMPVTTEATGCAERKEQAAASAANLTRYTKRYNYELTNMKLVCSAVGLTTDQQADCRRKLYKQMVGLQATMQQVTANHKQLMVRWTRPSCCLLRPRQLQSFFCILHPGTAAPCVSRFVLPSNPAAAFAAFQHAQYRCVD